jgi:hypothetical protein
MLLSPGRTDAFCALSLGIALTLGTVQIVNEGLRAVSPIRSGFFCVISSLLVATCLARFHNRLQSPGLGWVVALGGSLALMVTGGAQGVIVWRERKVRDREQACEAPRLTVIWKDPSGCSVSAILVGHEARLEVRRASKTHLWLPGQTKIEYGSQRRPRWGVFLRVVGRSVLGGLAVVVVVVWAMLDVTSPRGTTPLPIPGESLAFAGVVCFVAVIVAAILLFTETALLAKGYRGTVAARVPMTVSSRDEEVLGEQAATCACCADNTARQVGG